jgi:hypothetical protein
MIRIRYRQENSHRGLIVLESDPQVRSVCVQSSIKPSERYPFPYVIHVIEYTVLSAFLGLGKNYMYCGTYDKGLKVFMTNKPLESLEDMVYCCPTEYAGCPTTAAYPICTDHRHDWLRFPSTTKLVQHVIGLWWQMTHRIYFDNYEFIRDWKNIKPENVLNTTWPIGKIQLNRAFDLTGSNYNPRHPGSTKGANSLDHPIIVPANSPLISEPLI